MGFLRNEPLPERLPDWTPFVEVDLAMPADAGLRRYGMQSRADAVFGISKSYANSRYIVTVERPEGKGKGKPIYLTIKDLWRSARHDWRDFQCIKNELVGEEQMMLEIYPPESRLVDMANQFHLWGFEGVVLHGADGKPLGFGKRNVTEYPRFGAKQRPFQPHTRPKDLEQRERMAKNIAGLLHAGLLGGGKKWKDIVGRNEPCPCGSGKKFKKCCGAVQR
jgi:hypothetical protein